MEAFISEAILTLGGRHLAAPYPAHLHHLTAYRQFTGLAI